MTKKYICIHGHFYQPPRENAWLESVESQDSAAPFHDWNDRINFECYAPNTAARILDEERNILNIVNNYTNISFNFGATLLSWMETADPDTYAAILEADRLSLQKYDGHGAAIAQVHSHLIMPLANERDKKTQIAWGIADFTHRFGRHPEGMWLAETAVDTDTLEALAAQNIKFTILAPRQAKAVRRVGSDATWREGSVDTRQPYLCQLPSGKSIALYFYDGDISQSVAFNGLLNNGKGFAKRLLEGFSPTDAPQLVNIATDGESYGHHHRYGEMALADCLYYIEQNNLAQLTNYGQYLSLFPPQLEVQIHENSSWSCVHGVERWRADCGCCSGGRPDWNQKWRKPLRDTLNWLRDAIAPIYEFEAQKLLTDPWKARDEYASVMVDRNEETTTAFLKKFALRPLSESDKIQILRLLEMQRDTLLMFTSCGWFFDEISGIETNQILQYALRAVQFAAQTSRVDLHEQFVQKLAAAPSNVYPNGAFSYQKNVLPSSVDLTRVGMHYAVVSLFEKFPQKLTLFNYTATSELFERIEAGNQKLAVGRTVVKSKITYSDKHFSFAVLYLGQQNIIGNISINMSRDVFDEMQSRISAAFRGNDLGEVIGIMQRYFGSQTTYTLWHLFSDEKRKLLHNLTEKNLRHAETALREFYNDNYQLMATMQQSNILVPDAYKNAVQFIVNTDLHRYFEQDVMGQEELQRLTDEFKKWGIEFSNKQSLKLTAGERIFEEIRKIDRGSSSIEHLQLLNFIAERLEQIGVKLNNWKSQNQYFSMIKAHRNGEWWWIDEPWRLAFAKLGAWLKVKSS